MANAYRFSGLAREDFQRVYLQGYDQFGPNQAETYTAGLMAAVELLAEHPLMARERTEYDPPLRLHRYGSHIIVYRAEGPGVVILRIRHGREDWSIDPLG